MTGPNSSPSLMQTDLHMHLPAVAALFPLEKKPNPEHTGPSLQLLPPAYHPSPSQRKICPVVKKHKQGHYHVNPSSIRTDQSLYFLKHWGLLKAFPNLTAQSPTSWNVIQGKESTRWSFLPAHAGARPERRLRSTPGACGALKQVFQLRRAHKLKHCLITISHI